MGQARRWVASVAALGALTALAPAATAQTVVERRNFSVERFRLSLDKNGLLSTEWAEVPAHLSWDVSLWLGYADDPLALYREDNGERTRVGSLVSQRLGGGIVFSLGLLDWVQLGVELPLVFYQDRDDTLPGVNGQLQSLSSFGVGGPRIAPKLRILSEEEYGLALAFMPSFVVPTANRGEYAGQDSLLFEPELLLGKTISYVRLALNLGLRLRRPESVADLEVDNELFARLAGGVGLDALGLPQAEVEAVISAGTDLSAPFERRAQTHVEALLGGAYDFEGPLSAFTAFGVGLNQGHGTPDWRVLAGLRVSEHGRDEDKDGIFDEDDACPKQPEDHDGFADEDGCPEPDNDRDGVLDAEDRAPLGAEDPDGFSDEDGLPDPDNDADGVWDWDDACINEPGLEVNMGCPDRDRDKDGIVDRLDKCPAEAEDSDGHADEDGCPDPDNDSDGVLDADDPCPTKAGPIGNRGCPDLDRDGDGIVDRLDNCPKEPGSIDEQGCKKKQLVVIVGDKLAILDKVFFSTARARIKNRSFELLDNVAKVLKDHPELKRVEVQGHTDDRGRDDKNMRLSQRRAESVLEYLVRKGVDRGRLVAQGYGETTPIAPNQTKDGRAENRRVEFKILERAK